MNARYALVRGDPQGHKVEVLELLKRNLIPSGEVADAHYRKYYESNPAGPPILLLAQDSESHHFVGTGAIFPTRLRLADDVVLGGISGDFAVDAAHRGFGPAVALQEALLEGLEERGLSYVYGVPNRLSEAVTKRVGYADLGRFTRFVKILRTGVILERYVRRPSLARLATGIASLTADPMLSLLYRERLRRPSAGFSVEKPETFDDRFSAIWEAARRQHRVTTYRDAAFLNWKYEKAGAGRPTGTYSILALLEGDEAAGYVVYRMREDVREVLDIAFLPSGAVADALLSAFVVDARRERNAAIHVKHFGPSSLLTQRLRAFGFLPRKDEDGLRVFANANSPPGADLLVRDNWCLLPGAQDI